MIEARTLPTPVFPDAFGELMQGFIVTDFLREWHEAVVELQRWVEAGQHQSSSASRITAGARMALGLSVGDYTDDLRGDWAVPVLPLEEVAVTCCLKAVRCLSSGLEVHAVD